MLNIQIRVIQDKDIIYVIEHKPRMDLGPMLNPLHHVTPVSWDLAAIARRIKKEWLQKFLQNF